MAPHMPPDESSRPALFRRAGRHAHFGKAAERSFVSQPTLSAQIKKLENYLGVQLIERQPRA